MNTTNFFNLITLFYAAFFRGYNYNILTTYKLN